ncbi:MAG: hypothetical protein AAFX40_14585, partial [Cyanobacteria bacterium J06639_1]
MLNQYTSAELRSLASTETTHPEILKALSKSADASIRESVAQNPNVYSDVLFQLGQEFPRHVLQNPAFSFIVLDSKFSIDKIPEPTLQALLALEEVPEYFVALAVLHAAEDIQLQWTLRADAPPSVLNTLTDSPVPNVSQSARSHVNLAGEFDLGYLDFRRSPVHFSLPMLANYIIAELLDVVTASEISLARGSAFYESSTAKAIETVDARVRAIVGEHLANHKPDALEIEQLKLLATICDVPRFIAEFWVHQAGYLNNYLFTMSHCKSVRPSILEQLATYKNGMFHQKVALHPNVTPEILAAIAAKIDPISLARSPGASPEMLEQLGRLSSDCNIRKAVVRNENTPLNSLKILAVDRDPSVAEVARRILGAKLNDEAFVSTIERASDSELEKWQRFGAYEAAKNPLVPVEIMRELIGRPEINIRKALAQNPSAPPDILIRLAEDELVEVRSLVVANLSSSTAVLDVLVGDSNRDIRQQIAAHPNVSESILFRLARDESRQVRQMVVEHAQVTPEMLRTLAADESDRIRARVAAHPLTPSDVLAELAFDINSSILWKVGKHANTPLHLLFKELTRVGWVQYAIVQQMTAQSHHTAETERILDILADTSTLPLDEILLHAIVDGTPTARAFLASRFDLPETYFALLASSDDTDEFPVWMAIADNPNAPARILATLADKPSREVLAAIADHPHATPELRAKAVEEMTNRPVATNHRHRTR